MAVRLNKRTFLEVVDEENSISSSQVFTLGCCSLNLGGGFTHCFFAATWADDSFQMGGKRPPTRNVTLPEANISPEKEIPIGNHRF